SATDVFGQTSIGAVTITVNAIATACEQTNFACTQPYIALLLCPDFCEPLNAWGEVTKTASMGGVFPASGLPNCFNFVVNDTSVVGEIAEVVLEVCDVLTPGYCSTISYAVEIANNCDLEAIDDVATTAINTTVTIDVTANDVDPQDDAFSLSDIFEAPQHGTASIVGNSILYTPNEGYTGTDVLAYVVCDPYGHCDGAAVTITIGIPCETAFSVCTSPIAPTEICVEFCTLVDYEITDINHSQMCSVAVISDTCFQYIALPDATGIDSLTVTGCNATGQCETMTVLVTVDCIAPQAVDDVMTAEISEFSIANVAQNDIQNCNYDYTTTLLTEPTLGEAAFIVDGILYYEPAPNSGGQSEILSYQICNVCDPTLCSTA
ncbi:MAG TPA: Ig-like domain-containing protein, partial [Chitinophagales bacterium]|nr:Ig-like domain-containing protein [Chitinophagales bacterium]